MLSALAGLAGDQARMMARHIAAPAISALVGTFFVLLAVAALFAALFLWLEQTHGPVVAALSVSLVAFALGLVALLPLLLRRRRPIPPPASAMFDLASTTVPKMASLLGPRQIAIGAVVLALVFSLTSRHSSEDRQ